MSPPDWKFLLEWLGKEDMSRLGECKGQTLDELVRAGLAQIGTAPPGLHADYSPVTLTLAGKRMLNAVQRLG